MVGSTCLLLALGLVSVPIKDIQARTALSESHPNFKPRWLQSPWSKRVSLDHGEESTSDRVFNFNQMSRIMKRAQEVKRFGQAYGTPFTDEFNFPGIKNLEPFPMWKIPNEPSTARRREFFLKRTNNLSPFRLRKKNQTPTSSHLSPFRLRK